MSRIIVWLIAIPLLLIIAAVILLPLLLDKDKILELASAALYEQTGASLTVGGEVELDLFPNIGLSLADVGLTMPQEQEPGLQLRALQIGVQLMPLLSGTVEIDTLAVDGLATTIRAQEEPDTIDTSKLSDEQLDAFYAERRQAQAQAGAEAGAQNALALPLALKVQTLQVTDARLELVDVSGTETTVIELQSLEATGLNLDGRPIPLALEVRLPGEQPIELSLDGKVQIDQDQQLMNLDDIQVVITGASAQSLRLQTGGQVDMNRQIADLQLLLELGETRGEGTVRYASFESPQIDASLKLNLFDPALLALAGPAAAAESSPAAAPSSGDEPLPLDALRLIDTRAELLIERAVFDAHTISNLQVKLRALDGIIQVSSLTGDLHGGKLDLQATFNGKHNIAKLDTTGQLAGLDMATALAAMESRPILTGTANLDWTLTSKGRSSNQLVAALTGPIKLGTEQMVLKDIALQRMICQAVALVNQERLSATFPTDTAFQALSADIQLGDGKAQLRPLRAELSQVALKGNGALDLLSQDFKTTFKASLSPELEQVDRACRVSKRLTAIDWPVKCAGNVNTDPAKWCSVDTAAIIADMAKSETQRQLKKEGGKLLDKLFKK